MTSIFPTSILKNSRSNPSRSRSLACGALFAASFAALGSFVLMTAAPASADGHEGHSETPAETDVVEIPEALNFTVPTITGEDKNLADYAGQVVLVVNTASRCGMTPQYAGLQALHESFAESGLAVIGFPANNFGGQEPGTEAEIADFCTQNYGVTFDMFSKVSATGDDTHPLFAYLTEHAPDDGQGEAVRWNFEKFLIDRNGEVIARFRSRVSPDSEELLAAVQAALGEGSE